jgi:hypothetical protein
MVHGPPFEGEQREQTDGEGRATRPVLMSFVMTSRFDGHHPSRSRSLLRRAKSYHPLLAFTSPGTSESPPQPAFSPRNNHAGGRQSGTVSRKRREL